MKICLIESCTKVLYRNNKSGYCTKHYDRSPQRRASKVKTMEKFRQKLAEEGKTSEYWREKNNRFADRINQIKLESGCADCGYNDFAVVLEFDHLDPEDKEFTIGNGRGHSWESIEVEIAKCDVVCANCHRIRTCKRLGVLQ